MSTTTKTISNTTKQKRKMPSTNAALQPHQRSKSYHTAHGKYLHCKCISSYETIL